MSRHDADLDLLRRDDAGTVGTQQERPAAAHAVASADHVAHGNALRDAHDQVELRVDCLIDGGRGARGRHVDHAHRRAGGVSCLLDGPIDRNALEVLARFFGIDPGDEAFVAVRIIATHARVELTRLTRDALGDDSGVLVHEDAHGSLTLVPGCSTYSSPRCSTYSSPRRRPGRRVILYARTFSLLPTYFLTPRSLHHLLGRFGHVVCSDDRQARIGEDLFAQILVGAFHAYNERHVEMHFARRFDHAGRDGVA